jgi:hypothetical protein
MAPLLVKLCKEEPIVNDKMKVICESFGKIINFIETALYATPNPNPQLKPISLKLMQLIL